MAKVVVSQFVSADGVMEDPGGAESYAHGGWSFKFDRSAEGDKFKYDEIMASDSLLLGRVTYDGFAKAWPSMQGEFADKFNGMQKYVVSSTIDGSAWDNTEVIAPADLAGKVGELRAAPGGDILINGSAQLVDALTDLELIDEYRLMTFPVILGPGKRMFTNTTAARTLKLVGNQQTGDATILTYVPADAA